MAEFRLALGGAIDVVTPKEMDDKITGLQGHIDSKFRRTKSTPIRRTTSGSFSGPLANGVPQVLQLGIEKPGMGRIWAISRITIIGNDDNTTAASLTVAAYVGDPATPMLGSVVIPGQVIPYFSTFSRQSLWVHDSESLFFMINPTAAIANQNIVVNVSVSEFFDETVDQQYA